MTTSRASRSWRSLARRSSTRSSGRTSHRMSRATGSTSAATHYLSVCVPSQSYRAKTPSPSLKPLFESSHRLGSPLAAMLGSSTPPAIGCVNWSNGRWRSTTSRCMRCGTVLDAVESDPMQFKWDLAAEQRARRGLLAEVRPSGFQSAIYRPFFRQHYYMDRVLTSALSQIPKYFPHQTSAIPPSLWSADLGRLRSSMPAVFAVDTVPEMVRGWCGCIRPTLSGPSRYTYVETSDTPQGELLPVEPHRHDNISDESLGCLPRPLRGLGDEGPHLRLRLRHPALAGLP